MADTAAPPKPSLVEKGYATTASNSGFWGYSTDDPELAAELRWPYSNRIFDAMERQDPQVASVMLAPRLLMLATTWRLDGTGCRDEVTEHVAKDLGLPIAGSGTDDVPVTRRRDRFSWYEHLNWATRVWRYGHMPFEQVYSLDEATGLVHLRKLGPRWPRSIVAFNVARDGGLESITQASPGQSGGVTIPMSQLVMYCNEREGGAWQGQSVIRPAYKDWMLKDRKLRSQQGSIDRNSMGVPVATAPENVTDIDPYTAIAKGFRAGDNSGAGLPFGAKIELLGVTGTLLDPLPAIRYHDEAIAKTVLLHFLNLGQATGTGSYALGATFKDFFTLGMQARGQQIADVASMHIVEDLVDLNWGPDEPAPKITFQAIGSQQEATAAAINLLVMAGVLTPDQGLEAFMRSTMGIPAQSGDANAPRPTVRETVTEAVTSLPVQPEGS